jgi:hypothetical protein
MEGEKTATESGRRQRAAECGALHTGGLFNLSLTNISILQIL